MKIKDIMAIVAVAVMTGGCNQQDDGLRQGNLVPIRLSASIDGNNTRTTVPTADTDDDTQDTQFLTGQAVDAYIKVKGGSWMTGLSSTTPRHFEAEGDGRLTRKSGEATDYYPMDATPVVIYAVHPSYTSAADFTVSTDQTNAADYAASDLCYSKTTEYNRQEAANTLSFNHVMSKLIVHVDVSGLGGTPTVSNLKVRAKTKTTMTYPTGSGDDYSLGTATTPAYISMNEDGAVIIPPQTTSAVGDVRISFSVSGFGPIAYEFPADFTFAPNTEYNYTVRVGSSITVTSSIATWGSGVNKNKAVQIARPTLPIEYCAEYNMMSATEMAPDNHVSNLAYFYWGTNTSTMSTNISNFNKGITISGNKYHLPSKKEWVGVIGNSTWGESSYIGYGRGTCSDQEENCAWGVKNSNGTYSYDVDRSFYNDYDYSNTTARIGYGLRFRERINGATVNGLYTCAYRYEYVDNATEVGNATTYVKVKYIGANQNVSIATISNEAWWNSITPDCARTFPATGHKGTTAQDWPKGTFSKETDGTKQNERGYYWSCDKKDGSDIYSMKAHETGTYGWASDVPSYTFTVRLFKDK